MNDPPPSEVVSIHRATGDNDIQRVTTVESPSAEGKEEIETTITEKAGISALVGSSERETAPCPVKETEKLHPSGTTGHLKCDMTVTEEAGISALVGSSEQETAPCPVKEAEKLHPSGTTGHLICDIATDSTPDVGTHGAAKIGEPQRTTNEKVAEECTKDISMPPVLCESSEKQGDGVMISVIKDDEETLQEVHEKSSSKVLGNH